MGIIIATRKNLRLLKVRFVEERVKPAHADLFDFAHNANDLAGPFFVYLFRIVAKENLLPDRVAGGRAFSVPPKTHSTTPFAVLE